MILLRVWYSWKCHIHGAYFFFLDIEILFLAIDKQEHRGEGGR